MQTLGVTGKVYNKEVKNENDDKKIMVKFTIGVRKRWVTDEDKDNNTQNVFLPMIAFGQRAKYINNLIENGDLISVADAEYQTFEFKNNDGDQIKGHNFRVNECNKIFVDGDSGNSGGSKSSSSGRKSSGSKRKSGGRRSSRREAKEEDTSNNNDDGIDLSDDDLPF